VNKRYYIPETFENPYFSADEIKTWNSYLEKNYRLWIIFENIVRIKQSANSDYYSSRQIIWSIRAKYKMKIPNAISRFLGWMFNTKYKTDIFKLK
jgi:hypothetical protein